VTVLLVTGTDTGVGKTVVTAAVASAATTAGCRVAVLKAAQTGIAPDEPVESDTEAVVRLAAPASARTVVTYSQALAPLAAAEEAGVVPLAIGDVIEAVRLAVEGGYDPVLIEGAGGLLVPMGAGRWTVADLAVALRCRVVVVARAGLGTLNHTALTMEALDRRGLPTSLVFGAWPEQPELVHWRNLVDLPGDLAGVVPDGVGDWPAERFRHEAVSWLSPRLYGRADPVRLRLDGVSGPPPPWPSAGS
jgi:dethiobiotin synthetase